MSEEGKCSECGERAGHGYTCYVCTQLARTQEREEFIDWLKQHNLYSADNSGMFNLLLYEEFLRQRE
jgi:methionyl-tRNA synthetase